MSHYLSQHKYLPSVHDNKKKKCGTSFSKIYLNYSSPFLIRQILRKYLVIVPVICLFMQSLIFLIYLTSLMVVYMYVYHPRSA